MADYIVVWSGGELLPPRRSGGWPFAHEEGPMPEGCPRGVRTSTLNRWKDRGFRLHVAALVQEGWSYRRVAVRLGVTFHQVRSAIRAERRELAR